MELTSTELESDIVAWRNVEIDTLTSLFTREKEVHSDLCGSPVYHYQDDKYVVVDYLLSPESVRRVVDTVCGWVCVYNVRIICESDLNKVREILEVMYEKEW
jgi:hypothetical protein